MNEILLCYERTPYRSYKKEGKSLNKYQQNRGKNKQKIVSRLIITIYNLHTNVKNLSLIASVCLCQILF